MKRIQILSTIAGLALIAGAPALAGPGGGQSGGQGGGADNAAMGGISDQGSLMRDMGRESSQGAVNANERALERANENSALSTGGDEPTTTTTTATTRGKAKVRTNTDANTKGVEQRTTARANSQGTVNANVNGLANANANSALAVAGRTDLTGLATDMTVTGSGDATIGTVSQVITNSSGAVVGIQVELEGGGMVTIPASSLTLDGTTLTTTWMPAN